MNVFLGSLDLYQLSTLIIALLNSLVFAASIAGLILARRSKLAHSLHCMCGYSLKRNTTGRCPECGKATTAFAGVNRPTIAADSCASSMTSS